MHLKRPPLVSLSLVLCLSLVSHLSLRGISCLSHVSLLSLVYLSCLSLVSPFSILAPSCLSLSHAYLSCVPRASLLSVSCLAFVSLGPPLSLSCRPLLHSPRTLTLARAAVPVRARALRGRARAPLTHSLRMHVVSECMYSVGIRLWGGPRI